MRMRADMLTPNDLGATVTLKNVTGRMVAFRAELSRVDEFLGREDDEPMTVRIDLTTENGTSEWWLDGTEEVSIVSSEIGDAITHASFAIQQLRASSKPRAEAINEAFKIGRKLGNDQHHVSLRRMSRTVASRTTEETETKNG